MRPWLQVGIVGVFAVASLAACSGTSGAPIPPGPEGTTEVAPTDPASPSGEPTREPAPPPTAQTPTPPGTPTKTNGAPTIVKITIDRTNVGPGETVTLLATVTDPDGDTDIKSGVLLPKIGNVIGQQAIATFARKTTGEFNAGAGLAAFHAAQALTLGPYEIAQRTYVAQFVDTAGHIAEKDVALTIEGRDLGICQGNVVASFFRDCTACAATCPAGTTCLGNQCSARLDCAFASFTCSSRCLQEGKKCLGAYAVAYPGNTSAALAACGATPRASFVFGAAACAQSTSGDAFRSCYCSEK